MSGIAPTAATPDFAAYLDPERMQTVLEAHLPDLAHGNRAVISCTILHARYKTSARPEQHSKAWLAVAYRLELRDRSSDARTTRMLYAKAFPGDRSYREFETAVNARLYPPGAGYALVHLPNLGMLVWSFPNDPALPQLPDVVDGRRITSFLPYDSLPPGIDGPDDITLVAVDVLRYRPESRCSMRYRLRAGQHDLALFGKTFHDDRGQSIDRMLRKLWQRSREDNACFTVAQPLGYTPAVLTVWQAALTGTPLLAVLERKPRPELLAAVAGGLVRLHHSELAPTKTITPEDKLREVRKKAAKLMQALPELRESLQPMVQRLQYELPRHTSPRATIHGDFDVQQLQVQDGRLTLFDFDDVAVGDPLQDLANFVVDLYFHAFDRRTARLMGRWLVDQYRAQVSWELPLDRLNWFLRAQFIKKAYWFLQHQKPGVEDAIQRTLMLARAGIELEEGP